MLPPAIPALLRLLRDKEQKTRANAAGALGNLVRNGGSLCELLVRWGVPTALMEMAARDVSLSARRIALFSIGNLAVYTSCRAVFMVSAPSPSPSPRTQRGVAHNVAWPVCGVCRAPVGPWKQL